MPGAARTLSAVIVVPSSIVATNPVRLGQAGHQPLVDVERLLLAEPLRVVEEDRDRDRVEVFGAEPRSSKYASNVCSPAASRCQSGPERRNMSAGICSRQNAIGWPTTWVSMPLARARAAADRRRAPHRRPADPSDPASRPEKVRQQPEAIHPPAPGRRLRRRGSRGVQRVSGPQPGTGGPVGEGALEQQPEGGPDTDLGQHRPDAERPQGGGREGGRHLVDLRHDGHARSHQHHVDADPDQRPVPPVQPMRPAGPRERR